jgi:hypothetical protein
MKKLLLVFLLLLNPLLVFAEINECKTDVYFANGIFSFHLSRGGMHITT